MLLAKDENLKTSSVYVGYLILKELKASKDDKVTIYEVARKLRKKGVRHSRQLLFGVLFLHSCGVADFSAPYIYRIT